MISVFLQLDDFRELKIRRFHSTSTKRLRTPALEYQDCWDFSFESVNNFLTVEAWDFRLLRMRLSIKNMSKIETWVSNCHEFLNFWDMVLKLLRMSLLPIQGFWKSRDQDSWLRPCQKRRLKGLSRLGFQTVKSF
jgi:hypothetical protein